MAGPEHAQRRPGHASRTGPCLRPFSLADGTGAHERDMASLVQRQLVFLQDGLLALTPSGTALHAKATRLVEEAREDLTAGIGPDEYAMAVSVLERMCNNAARIIAR